MMARKVALLGVVLALMTAGSQAAETQKAKVCNLERYSSIPIVTQPDGRIAVPVTVQGKQALFLVDTGGVSATMTAQLAKDIGLKVRATNRWLTGIGQSLLNTYVLADTFSLGRLNGTDLPVYIDPRINGLYLDGTLAPDMMRQYDVDFDFAGGKMNLFSPKHCPGNVVYWTRDGYIALPMDVAPDGHIRVPAMVDGKPIKATLDTGAMTSVMSLSAARALGITETSPGLKVTETYRTNKKPKKYSYPFKSLDLEGVAVSNPHIIILADAMMKGLGNDLILGVGIMRQLHLYIAYHEEKLYITPATAD